MSAVVTRARKAPASFRNAREYISGANMQTAESHMVVFALAVRTEYVPDNSIDTQCTDGIKIRFNEEFTFSLTMDELKGVNAHELMHIMLLHPLRRGNRDPLLWNYATDLVINWMLIKEGFKLPEFVLYSEDFANMDAEAAYDKIVKALEKKGIDPSQIQKGSGSGKGKKQGQGSGNGGGGQSGDEDESNKGKGQKGKKDQDDQDQNDGDGNGPKKMSEDEIADILADIFKMKGKVMVGSHDDWGKGSEKEQQEKRREALGKVREAVQSASMDKSQGQGKGFMSRAIEDFLTPQITWQHYLMKYCEPNEVDLDWTRPNRRFVGQGTYLPGPAKFDGVPEGVYLCYDTSGSVGTKELTQNLTEAQAMQRQFPGMNMYYMSCDYDVTEPVPLETVDGINIDVDKLQLRGGGGTSFEPPFKYLEANRDKHNVKLLIYFTDGYGAFPKERPYFDTLFVVSTKEIDKVPDWAMKVSIEVR